MAEQVVLWRDSQGALHPSQAKADFADLRTKLENKLDECVHSYDISTSDIVDAIAANRSLVMEFLEKDAQLW